MCTHHGKTNSVCSRLDNFAGYKEYIITYTRFLWWDNDVICIHIFRYFPCVRRLLYSWKCVLNLLLDFLPAQISLRHNSSNRKPCCSLTVHSRIIYSRQYVGDMAWQRRYSFYRHDLTFFFSNVLLKKCESTGKFLLLLTGSRLCVSRRPVHRRLRGSYEFADDSVCLMAHSICN
jgi:hypothetical protein